MIRKISLNIYEPYLTDNLGLRPYYLLESRQRVISRDEGLIERYISPTTKIEIGYGKITYPKLLTKG